MSYIGSDMVIHADFGQLQSIHGKDGVGISGAEVNSSGELVLTLTDETAINVGKITAEDGYTPVKGVDYWTKADRNAMLTDVIAALPVYNGEVV